MTPREFVDCFSREKEALLRTYLNRSGTSVASKIAQLQLEPDKLKLLSQILDGVLTDAFYTVLLGLEGRAGHSATTGPGDVVRQTERGR